MYCKLINPIEFRLAYKAKGFSQVSLAKKSFLSASVIQHAIAGHLVLIDCAYSIAKQLEVNIWDMFTMVKMDRTKNKFVVKEGFDLKKILTNKLETLSACSGAIGITPETLVRIYRSKPVTLNTARKTATYLGLGVLDLFEEVGAA